MASSSSEKQNIRQILKREKLFEQHTAEFYETVESNASFLNPSQDEVLYEKGDRGDNFFLVVDGGVELTRSMSGDREAKRILKQGATFGVLSVVTSTTRRATVRSAENMETTVLSVQYEETVESIEEPSVVRTFLEGVVEQLKDRLDRSSEVIDTLL